MAFAQGGDRNQEGKDSEDDQSCALFWKTTKRNVLLEQSQVETQAWQFCVKKLPSPRLFCGVHDDL